MDHNEAVRKFENLMLKEADQAYEAATELEVLVTHLPNEKSRQLAQLQVKASHKRAKDFRELAQKVKEREGSRDRCGLGYRPWVWGWLMRWYRSIPLSNGIRLLPVA